MTDKTVAAKGQVPNRLLAEDRNLSPSSTGKSSQKLKAKKETMKIKALALFSGGLDGTLAAKIVLDQGIGVEAVYFVNAFLPAMHIAGQVRPTNIPGPSW